MRYRNNKTGHLYRMTGIAVDATNSRDGTTVVIYHPIADEYTFFVREALEFHEKFTQAEAQEPQR